MEDALNEQTTVWPMPSPRSSQDSLVTRATRGRPPSTLMSEGPAGGSWYLVGRRAAAAAGPADRLWSVPRWVADVAPWAIRYPPSAGNRPGRFGNIARGRGFDGRLESARLPEPRGGNDHPPSLNSPTPTLMCARRCLAARLTRRVVCGTVAM